MLTGYHIGMEGESMAGFSADVWGYSRIYEPQAPTSAAKGPLATRHASEASPAEAGDVTCYEVPCKESLLLWLWQLLLMKTKAPMSLSRSFCSQFENLGALNEQFSSCIHEDNLG